MFLADHQIKELCKNEGEFNGMEIRIDPFNEMNVGANSYDLTLDREYRLQYSDWGKEVETPWDREKKVIISSFVLDRHVPPSSVKQAQQRLEEDGTKRHYIIIPPFHSVIIRTQEVVYIGKRLIGLISARSNLSYGLNMFYSSLVDTGFIGRLTARIFNHTVSEIWLPAGYRIMQIMFANSITPDTFYRERSLSKNLHYIESIPDYKIDKEWLGFKEPPKEELKEPPTPKLR